MAKRIKFYKDEMVEFELFNLVDYYDPILRTPTTPVKFDTIEDLKRVRFLAFSLIETLEKYNGLGLSANQVGLSDRVCVINMGDSIWTMFNPEIIEQSLVPSQYSEGCLSYPGLYLKVKRADTIKVRFQAMNGEFVEKEFSGLTAVCIQHEIDHLNGVLYTQKVSSITLEREKKKAKKNAKRLKAFAKAKSAAEAAASSFEPQPPPKIMIQPPEQEQKLEDSFVYKI
jgi:peptide deformylase